MHILCHKCFVQDKLFSSMAMIDAEVICNVNVRYCVDTSLINITKKFIKFYFERYKESFYFEIQACFLSLWFFTLTLTRQQTGSRAAACRRKDVRRDRGDYR